MASGFLPYILLQSKDIFQNNTPSKKLTPVGFLQMLLGQDRPSLVEQNIANGSGHLRDVKFKYRNRISAGKSVDTDDCDINAIPSYLEATIPGFLFRKYSIFLADADIAKYEKEASNLVSAGQPASQFPQDIWDAVIEAANGLFADINSDLLTAQGAAFGKNITTGAAAAKTINFLLNGTENDLSAGITMLMDDLMNNEIRLNDCMIVGSGLINKYYLQQKAKGVDYAGLDTSRLGPMPMFHFDPGAASAWGANQFGVFERNSVQLINVNKFNGFRAGDRLKSIFGTITLPVIDSLGGGGLQSFKFDYQLTYNDCPGSQVINGENTDIDRGWILTLMCNYNLFNIPNDAYAADDVLTGNNGTLLYEATNA